MDNLLIPKQNFGGYLDVRSENVLADIGEALMFYQIVKKRLMDVNNWGKICATSTTNFQLTLIDGLDTIFLKEKNLIKINIPGPGSLVGNGYDWVQIEKIKFNSETEIDEWFGFTVRPFMNPLNPKQGTAHFYTNLSTSTFIAGRSGLIVWAEIHGRNEIPNSKTKNIIDVMRNTIVGWTAKIGFSFPQWKLLADGLVKK